MSATSHRSPQTGPEDDIRLGGGRPRWLLPVVAVVVVALIAVGLGVKLLGGGGSDAAAADGSHFSDDFQIAYEADSASERAFLEYLNKDIAPQYGVSITPVGIGDGNQLDQATADGKYIANIYQHKHWLAQVVDKTGWKLSALGPVFQWSYSVYSEKYKSLDDLPQGEIGRAHV